MSESCADGNVVGAAGVSVVSVVSLPPGEYKLCGAVCRERGIQTHNTHKTHRGEYRDFNTAKPTPGHCSDLLPLEAALDDH